MAMPAASARKQAYSPPPVDSDYYKILDVLDAKERGVAQRVLTFAEAEIAPIIEDYWLRDEFPHESSVGCRR
jgi:glutaryl-CoA dehydrogenase